MRAYNQKNRPYNLNSDNDRMPIPEHSIVSDQTMYTRHNGYLHNNTEDVSLSSQPDAYDGYVAGGYQQANRESSVTQEDSMLGGPSFDKSIHDNLAIDPKAMAFDPSAPGTSPYFNDGLSPDPLVNKP